MGYRVSRETLDLWLATHAADYEIWAPHRFVGEGCFSDTDSVRYARVTKLEEIELKERSHYSFKEALTPASQTLFYFTQEACTEPEPPVKGAILLLRSCDLHALRRLDDMYLHNGPADYYYARLRERVKVVLLGCAASCESGFCVSMGTNVSENYDMSLDPVAGDFLVDCKDADWAAFFAARGCGEESVTPAHVEENAVKVTVPEKLSPAVAKASLWNQYDKRCINCGRCNFVCPTCTCFTMQDLYYDENARLGERRRVWASCMVDGFTDVAGGGSYRKKNGERMRFKVLHKMLDYKQRKGYQMCVGCGRCDDVCPEYISFSGCVNHLDEAMKEVQGK